MRISYSIPDGATAKQLFGDDQDSRVPKVIAGFAAGLAPIEAQIKTVCMRENLDVEVGFELICDRDRCLLAIALRPMTSTIPHRSWPFFFTDRSMNDICPQHFEVPCAVPDGADPHATARAAEKSIGHLTADFARDGLPKTLKAWISIIALLTKQVVVEVPERPWIPYRA